MPSTPQPRSEPTDEPVAQGEMPPPIPDEDGPHDVPDDKVIEKTLPEPARGKKEW